jgi:lysozyme family protein
MAVVNNLFAFIDEWEGLYSNRKNDKGGETMRGVTWDTYKSLAKTILGVEPTKERFKNLSQADARKFIIYFWNQCKASQLKSQRIANMLVDWYWGSGKWAILNTRKALNYEFNCGLDAKVEVVTDGMIKTLNRLNEERAYEAIVEERTAYYGRLNNTGNVQFTSNYKGWMNRLNDLITHNVTIQTGAAGLIALIGFFL